MKREIIPKADLERLIADELAKHSECEGARILGVYWHETDETGCNWDADTWNGNRDTVIACKECVGAAVRDLRARYNIVDPKKMTWFTSPPPLQHR